ncbi:hypothetical protein B0H14DRAFT_3532977 [Mycena olivaceomarginata]|nr:hypothetical protein B0H14DRAFT_3532977 [Mycena olivaceomarginata]
MEINPCRAVVIYQPVRKSDWIQELLQRIILTYDLVIAIFLTIDSTVVCKPRRGDRDLLNPELPDLLPDLERGERLQDFILPSTLFRSSSATYDYACRSVCSCKCHKRKGMRGREAAEQPLVDFNDAYVPKTLSQIDQESDAEDDDATGVRKLLLRICVTRAISWRFKEWKVDTQEWLAIMLEDTGLHKKYAMHCSSCCKCGGDGLLCEECCVEDHASKPLHRPQRWNGDRWQKIMLKDIGFVYQMGYEGRACEAPEEQISSLLVLDVYGPSSLRLRYCGCGKFEPYKGMECHWQQITYTGWHPSLLEHTSVCSTFQVREHGRRVTEMGVGA